MTMDARPPSAIRITRPYASEEEYLENDLETLTRTGITLVGVQPRPEGVVLRFELSLSTGQVVLRGEGRVVGFRANAHQGLGGLALRFTRLDVRSKALIDKAAAIREMRRPSRQPPPLSRAPAPPAPPVRASTPPPPFARASTPPPPFARALTPLPALARGANSPPPVLAGPDRNALLDRLRTRAKALDAEAVKSILERRRA
ncbi:MAG TPA: hypothetical protein VGY54_17755 [Polyangiaceae bacterium]|nr:hypothetical protein [Polyangiaceae bacterium]